MDNWEDILSTRIWPEKANFSSSITIDIIPLPETTVEDTDSKVIGNIYDVVSFNNSLRKPHTELYNKLQTVGHFSSRKQWGRKRARIYDRKFQKRNEGKVQVF